MPRRRGFSQGHSQRRRTGWEEGPGGLASTGISATASGFLGAALIPLLDGLTLVRTRGLFNLVLSAAASAGDGYQGAIGIGLTTASAVAAGIASVPTPITEQDWDGWLFWHVISAHAGDATAGSRNWDQSNQVIPVDSKAMRKFEDGMALFAAFEVTEIGTATASLFFDSRMLFKLP